MLLHQQTAKDIAGVEDVYRGILTSDDMEGVGVSQAGNV